MAWSNATNNFGPSSYVCGPTLGNGVNYTSIQSAINDASAAGGGCVYIRPNTYVGDLTLSPGVDLIGADSGSSLVIVEGEVTLTTTGTCNLSFLTINATGPADDCIQVLGAAAQSPVVNLFKCSLNASGVGSRAIIATGGTLSLCTAVDCSIQSTTSDGIEAGAAGSVDGRDCIVSSTVGKAYRHVSNGTSRFDSCVFTGTTAAIEQVTVAGSIEVYNSRITCSGNSAILFTAAGAYVGQGNVYFCNAASTNYAAGAAGTYFVGDEKCLGTAQNIAATLTQTKSSWKPNASAGTSVTAFRGTAGYDSTQFTVTDGLVQLVASSAGLTWVDRPVSVAVTAFTGNAVTGGGVTLTLPTTPANGTECDFLALGSAVIIVKAGGADIIRLGDVTSPAGGMLTSTALGDSIRLVYMTSSTTWCSIGGPQGNWTVS